MRMTTQEDAERVNAEVRRRIEGDEGLRGSAIKIRAYAGSWGVRVALEGTVGSWVDRSLAEQHAWAVPGVSGVDNSLIPAVEPS